MAAWERQQLSHLGFFWASKQAGSQLSQPEYRSSFSRLSIFLLACLMANSEKKTRAWPTNFPRHKRLMPVVVLKVKNLVDTIWKWKALVQFVVLRILSRELLSGLVLTLLLLPLHSSGGWFLAITSNRSCLPSTEGFHGLPPFYHLSFYFDNVMIIVTLAIW